MEPKMQEIAAMDTDSQPQAAPIQNLQNLAKRSATAVIKAETIASIMQQLGMTATNGVGYLRYENSTNESIDFPDQSTDDAAAFGRFVAVKLRTLSRQMAMRAQTEIITILQKYVLMEMNEE